MKKYKNVCLVVGAGASKGAIVDHLYTPPLDGEFLRTAQRIFKSRSKNLAEGKLAWRNLKKSLKSIGIGDDVLYSWRLETLTTYLEARANVRFENKGGRPARYRNILDNLNRIICYVLFFSGGVEPCPLHIKVIEFFKPKAIVSFNYDLILDQTLIKMGDLNWATHEYISSKTVKISEEGNFKIKKWHQGKRRPSISGIELLKLHGSMHWESMERGKGYRIAGVKMFPPKTNKILEYILPPEKPFIVPPVAAKMSIPTTELNEVWKRAHKKLKSASTWVIWGYSFPQTDTITSVLLKTCVQNTRGGKKNIVIINPDISVSARVKKLLEPKVSVEQYTSATEFLIKHEQIFLL